jgi:hypothetical protein
LGSAAFTDERLRIGSRGIGFPTGIGLFQNCPEGQSLYERPSAINREQRARLFGIPTDAAGMAKYYVLNADDLALVGTKRQIGNRLGFAVQLCRLRHPGQGLGFGERPPEAMIAFVARQVGALPTAFADYALRDQTRREHAVELHCSLPKRPGTSALIRRPIQPVT